MMLCSAIEVVRRVACRTDHEATARETLADEVVGVALEAQRVMPLGTKAPKRLPADPAKSTMIVLSEDPVRHRPW